MCYIVPVIYARAGHAILHQLERETSHVLSRPEVLEPSRRQLGVSHRVPGSFGAPSSRLDASTFHGCKENGEFLSERLGILLRLQLVQGPHLVATDGMGTRDAFLGPPYVQAAW